MTSTYGEPPKRPMGESIKVVRLRTRVAELEAENKRLRELIQLKSDMTRTLRSDVQALWDGYGHITVPQIIECLTGLALPEPPQGQPTFWGNVDRATESVESRPEWQQCIEKPKEQNS